MKTLTIIPSSLPQRSQFIRDKQGNYDLLGQIITQLGGRIEPGSRTPIQMSTALDPITVYLRQTVILTPLGYKILCITNLAVSQQIPAANKLLQPHNITISTTPVKIEVVDKVPYNNKAIRDEVEELLGMPVPQQYEDILAKGISLQISSDAIAEMISDFM